MVIHKKLYSILFSYLKKKLKKTFTISLVIVLWNSINSKGVFIGHGKKREAVEGETRPEKIRACLLWGGGVVWCGVVWCGVVWCGVVWCGVV